MVVTPSVIYCGDYSVGYLLWWLLSRLFTVVITQSVIYCGDTQSVIYCGDYSVC